MSQKDFVPETEDGEEDLAPAKSSPSPDDTEVSNASKAGSSVGELSTVGSSATSELQTADPDFDQRYLNDKWIGRFKSNGAFVEYVHDEWKPVLDENLEFVQQLWFEAEAAETQVIDGVTHKWNSETQKWEPESTVDEAFIASYQMNYGVQYDYSQLDEELNAKKAAKIKEAQEAAEKKKKKKKGPLEPQPKGWVDMEEKVHAVYVSNLPFDITESEFEEFMRKAGLIQMDPRTRKHKVKLYKDADGNFKGDGRCTYIRPESVEQALNLLDGAFLKSKEVKVEEAHFEMKGQYDPTKKPKSMTASQKKAFMDNQARLLNWKPDKERGYRPHSDCTVIVKNMFTIEMMNRNAALLLDLKEEMEQSCAKYGTVKKVVVYDNNPEGVVSVTFESTEHSDLAVKMLNGRLVGGRKLSAALWDGRTKYKIEESEEARAKRLAEWEKFIGGDEEDNGPPAKAAKTDE